MRWWCHKCDRGKWNFDVDFMCWCFTRRLPRSRIWKARKILLMEKRLCNRACELLRSSTDNRRVGKRKLFFLWTCFLFRKNLKWLECCSRISAWHTLYFNSSLPEEKETCQSVRSSRSEMTNFWFSSFPLIFVVDSKACRSCLNLVVLICFWWMWTFLECVCWHIIKPYLWTRKRRGSSPNYVTFIGSFNWRKLFTLPLAIIIISLSWNF